MNDNVVISEVDAHIYIYIYIYIYVVLRKAEKYVPYEGFVSVTQNVEHYRRSVIHTEVVITQFNCNM